MSLETSLENINGDENNHAMEGIEPFEASKPSITEPTQINPISSATASSDSSNGINIHKNRNGSSRNKAETAIVLTPEEIAAKQAEDARILALQQALRSTPDLKLRYHFYSDLWIYLVQRV